MQQRPWMRNHTFATKTTVTAPVMKILVEVGNDYETAENYLDDYLYQ
jgi:hypothetical protein